MNTVESLYKHPEKVEIIRMSPSNVVRRTTNSDGTEKSVQLFAPDYPDALYEAEMIANAKAAEADPVVEEVVEEVIEAPKVAVKAPKKRGK